MANLQVRDFPDDLHERLRAMANARGESLSALLRRELALVAERPTIADWLAEVEELEPVVAGPSAAEVIREGRREAGLE